MADDKAATAAESSICFTWGHYFPGREKPGMECFELARDFFDNLPRGTITNLMIGLATQGNFTNFSGYLVAQGPSTKIMPLLSDTGFLDIVSQARHSMHNFSVVLCDAGDVKTTERKDRYGRTAGKIPFPSYP